MKVNIIDTQKELREMRANEKRVANDKLKYPKVTGHTYPEEWKSPLPVAEYHMGRHEVAQYEAHMNSFNQLDR